VRARQALKLAFLLLVPAWAAAQPAETPNSILLIAKPELADPNFHQTVVLVTQAADASTVGVILNRPTPRRHEKTGEPVYFGGPVMREVLVTLFRSERQPGAAAFAVLKGVYLSMHPDNVSRALEGAVRHRLYAGFSGWAPHQLQAELQRDAWHVLPATEALVFRDDTTGMWRELLEKARGARTRQSATVVAMP
jgi:putative transcriptional regulator